jgi:class 3 adenylate cyclase/tetratricopeptide (TPR) repeat protein
MRCSACDNDLVAGALFCQACGAPAPRPCPNCAKQVDAAFRFCPSCGAALTAASSSAPAASPRPAAAPRSPAVPEALAQKILATKDAIEGERKLVTVMFCDLVGSTAIAERLDPEEYHDLLEDYLGIAFREIYRFEGIVNRLAGDGLMALFGAPIAHEDAPERAVRAALQIRQALERFNERGAGSHRGELAVRIGIHTGPVVVGTVGNDLKMDYTAIGDTTNLASRLESLAQPGTVLVSETTFRLVRGRFDMHSVGPLTAKGKSEPVVAYEVIGLRESVTPIGIAAENGLTPLVGRGPELAQLAACFAQLGDWFPQVVAIVGDAGSGKSRLVYEFKRQLDGTAVTFFEARCSPLHRVPYHPWMSMLRRFFGITPSDSAATMCERIATHLRGCDDERDEIMPYVCLMLSLPVSGLPDLSVDELKRREFEAVGRLFKLQARRGPVVIVIEDLHWIDEPSREMLDRAVGTMVRAPLMLLVTHRPEFRPRWQPMAAFTQVTLRRMLDAETTAIMRGVAGGVLPPELESLVLAKAEGSPFFAEEITRALLEGGLLQCREGQLQLTRPVDEILVPGTVQEVIAARLDRLGPHAKRVLQVAAVLGRQFTRRQLEAMLDGDGIDVAGALEELEQRGVIHRNHLFAGDEFRFGESLTQEVAYEALLLKQRRQLHERAGLLLEASGDSDPERWALLAHHFGRSDNRQKAVEALLHAARDAERVPSYHSAARLYREAWDRAETELLATPEPTLQRRAIQAAIGVGRMTIIYEVPDPGDNQHVLGRAGEMAEALGEPGIVAELQSFKGLLMIRHRKLFARGLERIEEALAIAQRADHVTPNLLRGLAYAYFLDGRFALALQTVNEAMVLLERNHDPLGDLTLGTRLLRARIHAYSDDGEFARRSLLETHELGVRAANRTIQCAAAMGLAQLCFERGQYLDARRWAERAFELANSIGFSDTMHTEVAILLGARFELGETVDDARTHDMIERTLSPESGKPFNAHILVEILLQLGELERAERLAQLTADSASGRVAEMIGALALGHVMRRFGGDYWPDAARCYEQAMEIARATGALRIFAMARLAAGRLALERGDQPQAMALLEETLPLCRELRLHRYAEDALTALAHPGAASLSARSA